jgi:AraC-type DNA-binding domain-containing proteins
MQNAKFTNSARYKCLEHLHKSSFDLSLCYCGIEECDPNHYYGPTERTEYLIHYIIEGKGTFQVNGQTYALGKNQLFLIYPGVTTYYVADQSEPWKYIWIAFNGAKAKTYLEWAHLGENNLTATCNKPDLLYSYVQEIINARELTHANDLKREGYLYLFLSALIQSLHESDDEDEVHDYSYDVYVNHALEFIEHNYDKCIKVNDIAKYIGINRSYLTNIFKKALDISVQDYLVNYRLEKGAELLKNTSLSIGSISSAVGYTDSLTFSKMFKRYKNMSPSEYRNSKEQIENSSQRIKNVPFEI